MPFINFDEFRECPIFKFFTLLAYTLLIYIINFLGLLRRGRKMCQ
jgi:hypothetical protein